MPTDVIMIKLTPLFHPEENRNITPQKSRQQTNTKKETSKQNKVEQVIPSLMLSWRILPGTILLR